jgi:hypothetical protein
VEDEAEHHLHVRAARLASDGAGAEGLWRISLHSVDAWALRTGADTTGQDDRGPFARLLGGPDPIP